MGILRHASSTKNLPAHFNPEQKMDNLENKTISHHLHMYDNVCMTCRTPKKKLSATICTLYIIIYI